MPKTPAQKKAQKDFMARGSWKQVPLLMKVEDIDKIKAFAQDEGIPYGAYIKQAISDKAGHIFTWDEVDILEKKK